MKKIISMILALAVVASLAVSASATGVAHSNNKWLGHEFGADGENCTANGIVTLNQATAAVRACADMVKVLSITEGTEQVWATHKDAITVKELRDLCEASEDFSNLTVFRQRTVKAAGEIDLSVKLWPCNPAKYEKQATVVLFRAEGAEEWTVVGYAADKVCDAVLPGSGAYVVAMAW